MAAPRLHPTPHWLWLVPLIGLSVFASISNERDLAAKKAEAERRAALPPEPPISPYLPITPAPLDQQPRLAYDFGMEVPDAILRASGYPIIRTIKELPVCTNSYLAKDAADAWKQNDRRWLDSMKNCVVLPVRTEAEWLKPNVLPDAAMLRIALRDGSRMTVYSPANNSTGLWDTFRTLSLSGAKDLARQHEQAMEKNKAP